MGKADHQSPEIALAALLKLGRYDFVRTMETEDFYKYLLHKIYLIYKSGYIVRVGCCDPQLANFLEENQEAMENEPSSRGEYCNDPFEDERFNNLKISITIH